MQKILKNNPRFIRATSDAGLIQRVIVSVSDNRSITLNVSSCIRDPNFCGLRSGWQRPPAADRDRFSEYKIQKVCAGKKTNVGKLDSFHRTSGSTTSKGILGVHESTTGIYKQVPPQIPFLPAYFSILANLEFWSKRVV